MTAALIIAALLALVALALLVWGIRDWAKWQARHMPEPFAKPFGDVPRVPEERP